MGAQRIKSYEVTPDDLERIEEYEQATGTQIPPHMLGDIAIQLAQQAGEQAPHTELLRSKL